MDAEFFSVRHDHILVFAKDKALTAWNRLEISEDDTPAHYDKVDASGRKYYLKPLRAMGGQGDSRATRPTLYFGMTAPDGSKVFPKRQDGTDGAWRWNPKKVEQEKERIDWIEGRNGWTPYYRIYADTNSGRPPETVWPHEEVGSNRTSKAEVKDLFPDLVPFGTPKPERLIERVAAVATKPGDWILDSFAGSGTTGAVARKMGRRWIMVELGEHCHTHIIPRLQKVVDGADPGGVSEAAGWKGGGGFRYYRLAPSLLERDRWGQWVISKQFNAAMLAEAACKLEGFTYAPSDTVYWQHGHSTERDFIYVTTQHLTADQLAQLSDEVSPERTLLVLCAAFRAGTKNVGEKFPNLTVKKIPKQVLSRCEWGHDDYSLKVENLPKAPPSSLPVDKRGQGSLFDEEVGK
jgi:adenine-specific DNA-methyltransferase